MIRWSTETSGIPALREIEEIPANISRWASMAVNRSAQKTRTQSARDIREQIAFPASYLAPRNERLAITKRASPADPESIITGAQRPTSLEAFVRGVKYHGRKNLPITVQPGKPLKLGDRAFLMNLRRGTAAIGNIGVAIRLAPGERISNKLAMVPVGNSGLYLLYGPSVDQVFREVSRLIAPDAERWMIDEFQRLARGKI